MKATLLLSALVLSSTSLLTWAEDEVPAPPPPPTPLEAQPAPVTPQYDARADVQPTPLTQPGRTTPATDSGDPNKTPLHPAQHDQLRTDPTLTNPDRSHPTDLRATDSNDGKVEAQPGATPKVGN